MSTNLAEAYKEIKNWSETLNEKVIEKTYELKNIYDQVSHIEKMASLGKLSATVAHELNNPLAGILTYSKLISKKIQALQKDCEHQKIIEFLDVISHEAARCGQIVKDLHTQDNNLNSCLKNPNSDLNNPNYDINNPNSNLNNQYSYINDSSNNQNNKEF